MNILNKISKGISRVCIILSCACSVGFVMCMLLQVILRNFFPAHAVSWADPMCRYFFIWGVYLASVVLTGEDGHIAVTILPDALKGTAKLALRIFNDVLFFALLVTISNVGFRAVLLNSKRALDAVPFSSAWVYAAIPTFSVLAGIQLIIKILRECKEARAK